MATLSSGTITCTFSSDGLDQVNLNGQNLIPAEGTSVGGTTTVAGLGLVPGSSVNGELSTGVVSSIYLQDGAQFYSSTPDVVIYDGGGSGAAATCTISGTSVNSITLTNGGSGYTSTPKVVFISGSTVTDATAICTINNANSLGAGSSIKKTIFSNSSTVRIQHFHQNVVATYQYTLNNPDLLVDIYIKNLSPTDPFTALNFQLPCFSFSGTPNGNYHCFDANYLAQNGVTIYHPSFLTPLAVEYAYDGTYGVAMHCPTHFRKETLFNAASTNDALPSNVYPILYVHDTVQPLHTLHLQINLRITNTTAISNLVGKYVTDLQAVNGPIQYTPDDRPIVQWAAFDVSAVTGGNPLGYLDSAHRLDNTTNIGTWENYISGMLSCIQGTIFWQPQGWNSRGIEYRPDFDCWPDTVTASLPTLISYFATHNIRFGLACRPADFITPYTYALDTTVTLHKDSDSQIIRLLERFKAMKTAGVTAYYIDSFGTDLNSRAIMEAIRGILGPNTPSYSEQFSDLMLPFSGMYCEVSDTSGNTITYNRETISILRMVEPKMSILAKYITGWTNAQIAAMKYTPLVFDTDASTFTSNFTSLISTYMTSNHWT